MCHVLRCISSFTNSVSTILLVELATTRWLIPGTFWTQTSVRLIVVQWPFTASCIYKHLTRPHFLFPRTLKRFLVVVYEWVHAETSTHDDSKVSTVKIPGPEDLDPHGRFFPPFLASAFKCMFECLGPQFLILLFCYASIRIESKVTACDIRYIWLTRPHWIRFRADAACWAGVPSHPILNLACWQQLPTKFYYKYCRQTTNANRISKFLYQNHPGNIQPYNRQKVNFRKFSWLMHVK